MLIKITFPIKIKDRTYEPGETIDIPNREAFYYIGREWAAKVAEVKRNDSRTNSK
jgi:hypothetical protein